MIIKQGVIMAGLHPIYRFVLPVLEQVYKNYNADLVITSGLDGKHSAGSKHYYGYAIDIRIKNIQVDKWEEITKQIRETLGCCFKVILESSVAGAEHIHLEVMI